MLKIRTTAKKLKVTTVIDVAPLAAMSSVPDNAPSRTELAIEINGRTHIADLATRGVRKAVKIINENGADNVSILVQGVLDAKGHIQDAGITVNVKVAKTEQNKEAVTEPATASA